MIVSCVKCGLELSGRAKGLKKYATTQGWISFMVGTDIYWRCFHCGPHQPQGDDTRGNR